MVYIIGFFVAALLSFIAAKFWFVSIPIAICLHIRPNLFLQGGRTRLATYKLRVIIPALVGGLILSFPSGILFSRLQSGAIGYLYLVLFSVGVVLIVWSGSAKDTPEDIEQKEHKKELDILSSPFNPDKFSALHTKEQIVRWYRGVNGELAIKSIDKKNRTALFLRRSNPKVQYRTTLKSCTCPDYVDKTKPLPCKHMYCLANELGLLEMFVDSLPDDYKEITANYEGTLYSRNFSEWDFRKKD